MTEHEAEQVEEQVETRRRGRPRKGESSVVPRRKSSDPVMVAVERTLRVAAMAPERRGALAAVLSVSDPSDTLTLAQAAVAGAGRIVGAADAVKALRESDPIESGILAVGLAGDDATTFRAAWQLIATISDLNPSPPATHAKAGLAMARAAQKLNPDQKATLDSIVEVFA